MAHVLTFYLALSLTYILTFSLPLGSLQLLLTAIRRLRSGSTHWDRELAAQVWRRNGGREARDYVANLTAPTWQVEKTRSQNRCQFERQIGCQVQANISLATLKTAHLRLLCFTCVSENRSLASPHHHHHHHQHHRHHHHRQNQGQKKI